MYNISQQTDKNITTILIIRTKIWPNTSSSEVLKQCNYIIFYGVFES